MVLFFNGYHSASFFAISVLFKLFLTECLDPPTYCESVEGAVSILDDDDDPTQMGSVTFTPMYTFVFDYRRPPAYSEVNGTHWNYTFILNTCKGNRQQLYVMLTNTPQKCYTWLYW